MTQASSAQPKRQQRAWKAESNGRTLAQRRADFAAQMRDMALSDLSAVAERLRVLHARLERETDRRWGQQEIAQKANVAYRTFQAWEGGKNENADGKGYEALARFYRRQLKDKTITRNWIVWGDEPMPVQPERPPVDLDAEQLDRIERGVEEILKRLPPPDEDDGTLPALPPSDPDPRPGEEGAGRTSERSGRDAAASRMTWLSMTIT